MEDWSDEDENVQKKQDAKVKGKMAAKAAAALEGGAGGPSGAGRTVEDIYQKKTQLEHILLRPDTYVGSVEKQKASLWVHAAASAGGGPGRLELRSIEYVPGLYKIFDEILVNAADNKVRDPSMTYIKVDVDAATGTIRVENDGAGIPVQMHGVEGVYVPELIFGHLLTSSNYDDTEKKTVGGRNGYGAKLANIFSTEFTIETCDGKRKLRYKQVFKDHMSVKSKPAITDCKATENWTRVTFKPDLKLFNMEVLEEDTAALMRKRAFDIAGSIGKNTKIILNGDRLPIKGFSDYVNLYLLGKDASQRCFEKINDRWEVCVVASEGQFQNVSFVNSINTIKGGTHVTKVADDIAAKLLERINKKNKSANVKPFQVKNQMLVFVNALIENPAFDSQTKETLTTKASAFGSKCEFSEEFMKKAAKVGIVEKVLEYAAFKQSKELKKTDGRQRGRLTGIPKLDDANEAGGKDGAACTLILTEGDSAKALAISGLSVVGRDHYGVFPLRGKLLNVRDASHTQIMNNAEISNIKKILGLQHGKDYPSAKTLRYGHLMIMTDQDHDGSHIKGLLINFLHAHFPSLLKIPNFLVEFITPIIKASKGKARQVFHTMPEYETWKASLGPAGTRGWAVKYYKGLGTSTAAEAKEYFAAMDANTKPFKWEGDEDGELIDMAFSKKKVEDRKRWLRGFKPGTFLDHRVAEVRYDDFVNKELILFSIADLQRSIPSVMDGLKPSQRKVLFACFKRRLRADIKVAQLSGYVSEHSAYHHGEVSLASTIVGLAQDYVGANNVNLLVPSGQFGTRLQGGKDHASPRYIFTRLAPLARALFPEADDALLKHLTDDGQRIEPEFYLPILPLLLVNGADGIGTGWSTSIPNYNPRDIVANLKRMLDGEQPEPMHPWYRGFGGTIRQSASARQGDPRAYTVTGKVRVLDDSRIEVTELPIGVWTQDYKEFLEGLVRPEDAAAAKKAAAPKAAAATGAAAKAKGAKAKAAAEAEEEGGGGGGEKAAPFITDYREHHTDVSVRFVITLPAENLVAAIESGLEKKFKLAKPISTSNMHAFAADGTVTRYDTPEAVLSTFFAPRLEAYARRRLALLEAAAAEEVRLDNKVRFITAVVDGRIVVARRARADLERQLEAEGYNKLPRGGGGKGAGGGGAAPAAGDDDEPGDGSAAAAASAAAVAAVSFDYLLTLPLLSLTREKVAELEAERSATAEEVVRLKATTPSALWRSDLDAFVAAYDAAEADTAKEAVALSRHQGAFKTGRQAKGKKAAGGGGVSRMEVDEDGSDDDAYDGGGAGDDDSDDDSDDGGAAARKKKAAAAKKKAAAAGGKKAGGAGGGAGVGAPAVARPCAAADAYAAARERADRAHEAAMAAPPKAPRGAKAAAARASLGGGSAADDAAAGGGDDGGAGPPAPKPARKPAAKKAAAGDGGGKAAAPRARKPKKGGSDNEEDLPLADTTDSDSDGGGLAARLAKRAGGAPPALLLGGGGGGAAALLPPPRASAPSKRAAAAAAAPKLKAAAAKVVLGSDDDEEMGGGGSAGGASDDDSDEVISDSDDDDDDAPVAKKKAAPKPRAKAAAAATAAAPPAAKKPAAAAAAKPRAKPAPKPAAPAWEAPIDLLGDDDDDGGGEAVAAAAPKPKPKRKAPQPAASGGGGAAAAKKPRRKASADSDDDDDDDAVAGGGAAAAAPAAAAPRPGRAAAKKAPVYTVSDDDDDDDMGGGGGGAVATDERPSKPPRPSDRSEFDFPSSDGE